MMLHGLGWLDRFPGSPEPEGKPGGPVDHKTARGLPPQLLYLPLVLLAFLLAQGARGGPIATGGVGEAKPRHWFLHVLIVCLSLGPSGSSWLPK